MGISKTIGKVWGLTKQAGHAAGKAADAGTKAANKLANYGARVDQNASQSWLLNGPSKEDYRKVKPIKQTIVININSGSRKRRRHR